MGGGGQGSGLGVWCCQDGPWCGDCWCRKMPVGQPSRSWGAPSSLLCRVGSGKAPHSRAPGMTLPIHPPTQPCAVGLSPAQLATGTQGLLPGLSHLRGECTAPKRRAGVGGTERAAMASHRPEAGAHAAAFVLSSSPLMDRQCGLSLSFMQRPPHP